MISERDLLDRFEAVKPYRQGEWKVTCPAHDDRDPSLHVTRTADSWLLCCHGGCETADVLAAVGLDWADLFAENGHRHEVETYPYTDESGRPLFEVVRYFPKDFRQRRPDGIWGLADTRRVLYRLPAVVAAVEAGEVVYVAEGEKDVHALERAGVTATTCPMGAGTWRPEYREPLRGARVVVVADRDEQGRAHAADVADKLAGIAAEVGVVEAATGKDATEHLAAGRTVEEFAPLADAPEAEETTAKRARKPESLIVDMAEAMRTAADPLPYVVEPFAIRGFLTVLAGRHSSGKSWLVTLLGSAVHRGRDELAGFGLTPTTALYVDAENGPRLLARRFRDAGIPADGLMVADGSELRLPGDLPLLGRLVKRYGAGLVVLDSLRRLAPGARENDSDDMAPILAGLAKLARDRGVAVVLIHHRSIKEGAARTRGSSAIEDQADCVFVLDRPRDDEDRRKLSVQKFRPDADPATRWLRLAKDPGSNLFALSTTDARPEPEADDGPTAEDVMADSIRALASRVRGESGWEPARLAEAVGAKPDSGTFKRALAGLLDSGEWEAEGRTRGRRLRPALGRNETGRNEAASSTPESIQATSVAPLGDGESGPNRFGPASEEEEAELERLRRKFSEEGEGA